MSIAQVACTYAMMILHDEGIPITAEKIDTLTKSANVAVESHWTRLFAKLAAKDIGELISNAVGSAPAPVAMAAPETAATAPAVEKKEEPEEDSDDDMGPLFDIFE